MLITKCHFNRQEEFHDAGINPTGGKKPSATGREKRTRRSTKIQTRPDVPRPISRCHGYDFAGSNHGFCFAGRMDGCHHHYFNCSAECHFGVHSGISDRTHPRNAPADDCPHRCRLPRWNVADHFRCGTGAGRPHPAGSRRPCSGRCCPSDCQRHCCQ